VRAARELVDLLDRAHVDLVVDVEAADVAAVALDEVDEVVDGAVLLEEQL
jgi:hypothetical protein